MAAATSRVRVGALVFGVPYRDPATLAKSVATVDQISGGRVEFAIGASWSELEFRTYGLPYPALSERYTRLDEALTIVKSLWTEPRTSFDGRYYQVHDAPCEPKPVQAPYPPIIIGGNGVGACTRNRPARYRLEYTRFAAETVERVELLERLCGEVGRDFDEIELSLHGTVQRSRRHTLRPRRWLCEVSQNKDQDTLSKLSGTIGSLAPRTK